KRSLTVIQARRRRLLLNLKEHLVQAKNGTMDGENLTQWLRDLQNDFVIRMTELDEEARKAELGIEDGEEEPDAADAEAASTQLGPSPGRVMHAERQHNQVHSIHDSIEHVDAADHGSQVYTGRSMSTG
ncbi:MutS protein msh4, partial [Teratosphaeriaceae sp. CCFEE 6253]